MVCHVAAAAFGKFITKCASVAVRAAALTAGPARFSGINYWHHSSYRCQEVAVSGYRFPPDATLRIQSDGRLSALTTTTLQ